MLQEVILTYWVQWLCGIIALGLIASVKHLYKKNRAVQRGIQALLRDRILQAYYHYSERGWITLHGLENVDAMYKEYHNLGGNGTMTKLVEDMRKLEGRDD